MLALRKRGGFLIGFGAALGLLLGGAELLLPGWISEFLVRTGEYVRYAHDPSLLAALFGALGGLAVGVVLVVALLALWIRAGRSAAPGDAMSWAVAATMCATVLIFPAPRPYNEVLVFPAILLLIANWRTAWRVGGRAVRYSGAMLAAVLGWPPVSAGLVLLVLAVSGLFSANNAQLTKALWYLPFQIHNLIPYAAAITLTVFFLVLQRHSTATGLSG